jgi:hypothetical protein
MQDGLKGLHTQMYLLPSFKDQFVYQSDLLIWSHLAPAAIVSLPDRQTFYHV